MRTATSTSKVGIDVALLDTPAQRVRAGGMGLVDVAFEHGPDFRIAQRFGDDLGAEHGRVAPVHLAQVAAGQLDQAEDGVFGAFKQLEKCGVADALGLRDGGDDGFLAAEIAVEVAGAHAGFGADVLHAGFVETGSREAGHRGGENPLLLSLACVRRYAGASSLPPCTMP